MTLYMYMCMCTCNVYEERKEGGERVQEREERERRERREREQTHLITSSFDILSLSQRKPATPNRMY